MVLVGTAIRQGLRIAGRIDRKYNINKIFVDKYVPPGYRKNVRLAFDVAGTLGGGYGIYNLIQSLYAPDSPGQPSEDGFRQKIQQRKLSKTYKSYKTRCRPTIRYRSKYSARPYNRFR